MYTTCMFCQKALGTNQVLESFPIGRRLAFDGARGRLWVVCLKCERWNLTPLEERWEAVEDCERLFRGTRIRVSSENIGLARHPEGLVLVRIGEPLRHEFAAWRYGDRFGRRRRRAIMYGAGVLAAATGVMVAGAAVGFGAGVLGSQVGTVWNLVRNRSVKVRPDAGDVLKLEGQEVGRTRVRPADDSYGFELGVTRDTKLGFGRKTTWYTGEEARRLASAIVPKVNAMGGDPANVRRAVDTLEASGHPERFLQNVAADSRFHGGWRGEPGYVAKMPKSTRLALEMALHEERERRAVEGELWVLERAWREAEEIAEIADNLLVPKSARRFIRRHRSGEDG
ncbi:MAG: hypothetical protein OXQ94_18455 [Gemmatimonadota bacterium]|nr:hypothetical protein [Gemmatimonadota bacterium]MDE2873657.1 hypothetical protein [Gemmatimonadota bacterium]